MISKKGLVRILIVMMRIEAFQNRVVLVTPAWKELGMMHLLKSCANLWDLSV
jgi:hypothetical protein